MRLLWVFVFLSACVISFSHPVAAQGPALTGELPSKMMGRWDVSFRSPLANVDTVWVVEPAPGGVTSVGTLGVNTVGLAIRDVSVTDGIVRFTGTTSAGPLAVTGALSPGQIEGNFTAGSISGRFWAVRRSDVRTLGLPTLFDKAAEAFAASLFSSAPFDERWNTKRAELGAQLRRPDATERDMVRSVRTLLAAAQLSHNDFYIPTSSELAPDATGTGHAVTWRRLENGLGYIRIDRFASDAAERDRLDQAFAELANTSGLVVDLTDNPGGDLGLAMRLGDHLLPSGTNGGLFATRKGIDEAGVADMAGIPAAKFEQFVGYDTKDFESALSRSGAVRLVTGGRAPLYPGQVALLINRGSGSSSEAVAAMLKETKRARLFGQRSAGLMLSSREIMQNDGYVLRVAYADFRTSNGAVAEKVGINPDEITTGDPTAALNAATEWLSQK